MYSFKKLALNCLLIPLLLQEIGEGPGGPRFSRSQEGLQIDGSNSKRSELTCAKK